MSTHLPGFQSFFRFFASFCFGKISQQQHKIDLRDVRFPWNSAEWEMEIDVGAAGSRGLETRNYQEKTDSESILSVHAQITMDIHSKTSANT